MFAAVVQAATAGGHQQSVSESIAGRFIVGGRVTARLVSDRGSSGRGKVASGTFGAWSDFSCHRVPTCCSYSIVEVSGAGRGGRGIVQATALKKRAFELTSELPCWRNDKLQQQDVAYCVSQLYICVLQAVNIPKHSGCYMYAGQSRFYFRPCVTHTCLRFHLSSHCFI